MNSTEGAISVSGGTVTYGGFTGSHWSRLPDNSKADNTSWNNNGFNR